VLVAVTGQVGAGSSVVIRPSAQPHFALNVVSTSAVNVVCTSAVPPVFCPPPPAFPSIHQALLSANQQQLVSANQQPVSVSVASVVPDPAIVKTLLASRLARNLTPQQTAELSQGSAANSSASAGNVILSSVPSSATSSSSLGCVSASNHAGSSPSPSSIASAAVVADIVAASRENPVSISVSAAAVGSVGVTLPAGEVENAVDKVDRSGKLLGSNGLADTATTVDGPVDARNTVGGLADTASTVGGPVSSVCGPVDTVNTVSSVASSSSPCLANGHAKPLLHVDRSLLVNGICSPVPSCSSEDQEPAASDVKLLPKSPPPGYDNGLIVNGDILDNENDDDDDDDDDVSELNDCEGDVLVKAMMHADILDCGGRPADADNSCDNADSESRASVDLSELIGRGASGRNTGTDPVAPGSDSETAAAVADLLHEAGMMTMDDEASNVSTAADDNNDNDDNCLSLDNSDDATTAAAADRQQCPVASEAMSESQCLVAGQTSSVAATDDDEMLTSAATADESTDVNASVFDCQPVADVSRQAALATSSVGSANPVGMGSANPVDVSSANPVSMGSVNPVDVGSANPVSAGLAQQSSSSSNVGAVSSAQLANGVMVVPPHGISLPSGQFISGGTRLLIRPMASPANGSASAVAVRALAPPIQPTVTLAPPIQPAVTAVSSSSTVVDGSATVSVSAATAPAVRFVSSTTSQGQVIIQRASPMVQRLVVPRPIAMRSEGQMILQSTPAQGSQQIASRPMLLTQAAGQLRVAAGRPPGSVQLLSTAPHEQTAATQIVLQSGHVISVQPQHTTHDLTDQSAAAAAGSLPVLIARPGSEQQQPFSVPTTGTAAPQTLAAGTPQLSTVVGPPPSQAPKQLVPGPLMSTSQPAMQMVPGPLMSTSQLVPGPVQLRAGVVGLAPGAAAAGNVILQHGGRPILLQSPTAGTAQPASSYVVFRPGALPAQPSSSQEHVLDNVSVSGSSSGSLGQDRKRPLSPTAVTRSMRKRTKKDDDSGLLPFMCEWAGCQR